MYQIPNRAFLPKGLYQSSCDGQNYSILGGNLETIQGSAIGFSLEHSMVGTIGEFCERYAASFEPASKFIFGSYDNLRYQFSKLLNPSDVNPYAHWQYLNKKIPYKKFLHSDEIAWVRGVDLLDYTEILIPAFLTYLPHNSKVDNGNEFILNTSTGISAGASIEDAIEGGFLECLERDAFSNFWYNQKKLLPTIPLYSQETILRYYAGNLKIDHLYKNQRVKIYSFDLTGLTSVHTVLSILYYKFKGRLMLSVGAASRFNKQEAFIKAALEAYQGIEYGILLYNQEKGWKENLPDFGNVDSYQKHFAFYNKFPELRSDVPILEYLSDSQNFSNEIVSKVQNEISAFSEVSRKFNHAIYYVNLTTEDIRQVGYHVVRVLIPDMAYLTGVHDRPFLGARHFKDTESLFTELPHFFP